MANIDVDYENQFAIKEAKQKRRILESQWGKIERMSGTINMKWHDGEPADGDVAVYDVEFDGRKFDNVVEPEWIEGEKVRRRLAKDYRAIAEKWALWKWHTERGTPVSEHDAYQTEPNYQPPTFVWAPRLGRPPKQ